MEEKLSALAAYRARKLRLPEGYHLRCNGEMLELHRHDGTKIAAFNACAPPSEVAKVARGDYYLTRPNEPR